MPRISNLQLNTRAAAKDELPSVDIENVDTKKITVDMLMPTGSILDFAGSSAPAGWLLCYGQTLNATTNPEYADLYAIIGNTYGGSSIADFVVPDLRGRVVAGADAMGGTAANRLTTAGLGAAAILGASGGSQTHTLTASEMPSHVHDHPSGGDWNYSTHRAIGGRSGGFTLSSAGASGTSTRYANASNAGYSDISGATNTAAAGGGAAHKNVQPTFILNKIIKY